MQSLPQHADINAGPVWPAAIDGARHVRWCPRCEARALRASLRDGIEVDVCRICDGVWLDRGELEQLIARGVRAYRVLRQPGGMKARDARR